MSSFRPKPKFKGIAQLVEKPQNFPSNERPLLLCIEYNGQSTSIHYAWVCFKQILYEYKIQQMSLNLLNLSTELVHTTSCHRNLNLALICTLLLHHIIRLPTRVHTRLKMKSMLTWHCIITLSNYLQGNDEDQQYNHNYHQYEACLHQPQHVTQFDRAP